MRMIGPSFFALESRPLPYRPLPSIPCCYARSHRLLACSTRRLKCPYQSKKRPLDRGKYKRAVVTALLPFRAPDRRRSPSATFQSRQGETSVSCTSLGRKNPLRQSPSFFNLLNSQALKVVEIRPVLESRVHKDKIAAQQTVANERRKPADPAANYRRPAFRHHYQRLSCRGRNHRDWETILWERMNRFACCRD